MSFVHPWAIAAGIAAAALPLAVHWLTRPRPTRMPLSTIRFVREVVRQRRARHRLRDFIVLLLRTAAVLLIALAIARPKFGASPLVSKAAGGDAVRVVVLDASQSMAASQRGAQIFERARTTAASYLKYRPGLRVNLIVAAATPHVEFEQASSNFEALRDQLQRAQVLPQRLDARKALEAAARMLAPTSSADTRRRELVVISDFQRRNWSQADFSVLPRDVQIELEPARSGPPPDNLALVRAACRGRGTEGRTARLEVEVGNFGRTARDATVEVTVGDASYRLSGRCAAGRITQLAEEIPLRSAGWHWGQAKLTSNDDALPADDVRPLVVQVRPRPNYALITRQAAAQRPSSSHFLECALAPDAALRERASARLTRLSPAKLDREALAPADLIVLDHPGKLDDASVKLLASLLRRGRPILYVTAETVDANNLAQLAQNAGRGLQLPVEFAPPPSGHARGNLFLTSFRRDDGLFGPFGDQAESVASALRFGGGLTSRPGEGGLAGDVLATYGDGSACVVLTASEAGSLAILNADLGASNLPGSAAFVPIIEELVQRLLGRGRMAKYVCGEPLVAQLPADVGLAAGLSIRPVDSGPGTADAARRFGQLSDDGAGAVWHWPSPLAPGAYRVCRGETTQFALSVDVPEEESDLESLPLDVLTGRLSGGRAMHVQAAESEGPQDRTWAYLASACVACIVLEVGALALFRG